MSFERSSSKKNGSKKQGKSHFKISWKGSERMGTLASLILAGVGIFGRDTTDRQKQKVQMALI